MIFGSPVWNFDMVSAAIQAAQSSSWSRKCPENVFQWIKAAKISYKPKKNSNSFGGTCVQIPGRLCSDVGISYCLLLK